MSSIAIPSLIKKVIILMVLMTICCQHNIILSVTCHIICIYLLVVLVNLQDNEPKPVLKDIEEIALDLQRLFCTCK